MASPDGPPVLQRSQVLSVAHSPSSTHVEVVMTSVAAQAADRSLVALISDEDTATGLLLAGIGHISTSSESSSAGNNNASGRGNAAGKGHSSSSGGGAGGLSTEDRNANSASGCHEKNFYIVNSSTPVSEIEVAFNIFTKERGDIAILLITQTLAEKIRTICDRYTQAFPALLEIPSKEAPYDPSKDSVLKRVQKLFGE